MKSSSTEVVLAIIPFEILSDNRELDYLGAGFIDDLIVDLSRFKSLQIISPMSTEKLKLDGKNELELIQSLKTNYFVKGSFRHIKNNLRISIQLVSVEDGSIVWAERYEDKLSSIFKIADDIIERIISALQEQIDTHILETSHKKKMTNLHAYECWLRGIEQLKLRTFDGDIEARKFFQQALKIEPEYSRAYTGLSLSYFNEWSCQMWERWDESQQGAFKYARKAVAIDDSDSVSLTVLGRIYLYKSDYEKAEHYLRKSLRLNPNNASNLSEMVISFLYLGRFKEAEKLYLKAKRLNPLNEEEYFASGALVYLELGNFEKSIELVLKTNLDNAWVDMSAVLAAAYYHLGLMDKVSESWNIYLTNFKQKIFHGKSAESNEAIRWLVDICPYKVRSNYISFLEHMKNEGIHSDTIKERASKNSSELYVFKKLSGLWEINFENKSVFLPDIKGYHDIKKLMEHTNKEIHCSELMGNPVKINDDEFVFDNKAKQSYKKRIHELSLDIDEAEIMNDTHKATELRKEYENIVEHLSKSLGIGGRTRKLNSPINRTRSAVTWRIRSATQKIEKAHPPFAKHLTNSIKTGIFCSYSPEKNIKWIF